MNYYKNPIRKELISLPILQMRKLRLREVRNLLKVIPLVSVRVRIESLNSQSPNVLPFANGDKWGLGTEERWKEKRKVCVTQARSDSSTAPPSQAGVFSRAPFIRVPCAVSPASPSVRSICDCAVTHTSLKQSSFSLAALFLSSCKCNYSAALGYPYSDHFYHHFIFLIIKMGCSLAVQWLRRPVSTIKGLGSVCGWGTKILHATWHGTHLTEKLSK